MYGWNKVGIIDNMATISLRPVHYANVAMICVDTIAAACDASACSEFPDIKLKIENSLGGCDPRHDFPPIQPRLRSNIPDRARNSLP
jgi:hypothetical protein